MMNYFNDTRHQKPSITEKGYDKRILLKEIYFE